MGSCQSCFKSDIKEPEIQISTEVEDNFHNCLLIQLHLRMLTDQLQYLMEMQRQKQQEEQYNLSERNEYPKAVEIHCSCQKQPKCQSVGLNSFYFHNQCLQKVWFYSDCQIKCERPCPSFSVKQALFDCRKRFVLDSNQFISKYQIRELERITNLLQLSELIKNSLDNCDYSQSQQLNFQKQVFESLCFQQIMLQQ